VKILITGSEGFIGCHLAAQLTSRGHLVHGLDNGAAMVPDWLRRERSEWSAIDTLRCDIRDRDALAKAVSRVAPEVVVHLAAKPGVADAEINPDLYDEVNVGGVYNVIHACRAAKVRRIVHASSSSVYGSIDGPDHE
jgi:nucleoside-diphosphate-sugar epimerase